MSGRTPSAARTPGTPSIIMSPDFRPWTQIRLGAGTRDVTTLSLAGGSRDDLNHNVFRLVPANQSMRRILIGLKVVRPRCAAGAPPRPRLRSTAISHEAGTGPKQHETTNGRLYGGPQHR
jgi:hypothetical protein